MNRKATFILAIGMVLSVSFAAQAEGIPCAIGLDTGRTWLATGVVTRVDGPVFYILGKDNSIYTIDAAHSLILANTPAEDLYAPRVGDTVRVYGTVTSGCRIQAARVRLLKHDGGAAGYGAGPAKTPAVSPEKQIKIIIEKRPEAGTETGREGTPQPVPCNWQARGLVMDVDYTGSRLKVRTSDGLYTINVRHAQLIRGNRRIGLGSLGPGDAVRITGNLVGFNEIAAQDVRVTRTRDHAYNALPELPASTVGVIRQIDYSSMTFNMLTERSLIVVQVDTNTELQMEHKSMAFMELKPGMRVKMSGYGNPMNGYVAQHIQIISLSP